MAIEDPSAYQTRMKLCVRLIETYSAENPHDPVAPILRQMLGLIQTQGSILGENLGTIANAVSTLVAERNDSMAFSRTPYSFFFPILATSSS